MKINFKIDYITLTAAHFTNFPQTEQSAKILQENSFDLVDRARFVQSTIGNRAKARVMDQIKGGNINIYT